jgi:hypothetical protein
MSLPLLTSLLFCANCHVVDRNGDSRHLLFRLLDRSSCFARVPPCCRTSSPYRGSCLLVYCFYHNGTKGSRTGVLLYE